MKTLSSEEFKRLYGESTARSFAIDAYDRSLPKTLMEQGEDFSKGFVKRSLSTAVNTASALQGLGQRAIAGVRSLGSETYDEALAATKAQTGLRSLDKGTVEGAFVRDALSTKDGSGAEKAGALVSDIAAFLLPSGNLAKAEKGMSLAGRALTEGAAAGTITSLQEGEINDKAKISAIIGAVIPIAGAGIKYAWNKGAPAVKEKLGVGLEKAGTKIQESVIRPSVADMKDGFKIENVHKYGIGGGLDDMLAQTETQLSQKGNMINDISQNIDEAVDLNKVVATTRARFGDKYATFADNAGMERVLNTLDDNVKYVAGENGKATFWQAVQAKRSAGQKGAWVFGNMDPDARATEQVYTAFYQELRKELDRVATKTGNQQLITLNKEVSELIPISHALIRRVPVAARNNMISLTDTIGLVGSVFDPKSLAVLGANKLSKSGTFAEVLLKAADNLKNTSAPTLQPTSSIGQRVFGGNADELVESIKNPGMGMSTRDVTRYLHPEDKQSMMNFIDSVRIKKELSEADYQIAEHLAIRFGIDMNKGLSFVANKFDEILQGTRPFTATALPGTLKR